MDGSGNVYVADYGNSTIRKVTPAGVVTTVVGVLGFLGNFPGPLPASLNYPHSVAVDQVTGNLFLTVDSAILVASNDLTISPTTATVSPGGQEPFAASGGNGGYTWSVSINSSGGSITSAGAYTAGSRGGVTDTVKVTDSNGASAVATVTVIAAPSSSGGCGQGTESITSLVGLLLAGAIRRRRCMWLKG